MEQDPHHQTYAHLRMFMGIYGIYPDSDLTAQVIEQLDTLARQYTERADERGKVDDSTMNELALLADYILADMNGNGSHVIGTYARTLIINKDKKVKEKKEMKEIPLQDLVRVCFRRAGLDGHAAMLR